MIRLYLTDIRLLPDNTADLLNRVSPERWRKIMRYRQIADRQRSLAAGLLLDHVFGPDAKRITEDQFGRPSLFGAESFNLSHSGSYVLLAMGGECPIGCDIQCRNSRQEKPEECDLIARRILHPTEWRFYEQTSDRSRFFYRFWTLKESYMKMTGKGFSMAPGSFAFNLENPENIRCYFSSDQPEKDLYFRLYENLPDYTAAACVTGQAPPESWESVRFA